MGTRQFAGKHLLPLALLGGDLLAVILFVYLGQRDHDLVYQASPLWGVLYTTGIFALPWAIAGWLLGAFPSPAGLTARALLARSLNTWLVTAPLGLLLRSYLLGRAVLPTGFIVATYVFGGLFLLGWRVAFLLLWKAGARTSRSRAPNT
jgi:hypothetical protein